MNGMTVPLKVAEESNLAMLVRKNVKRYGDRIAMRAKENHQWREISWKEMGEKIQASAKALLELGLGEGEMISLFSPNRPEGTIVDVATLSIRGVPVFIYPTSTPRQAAYIINDSESKMVFVGSQDTFDKIADVFDQLPSLKKIVALQPGIHLKGHPHAMDFDAFMALGRRSAGESEIEDRLARSSQDDLLTLIYTSGTTGEPKGVMLTHGNMLCSAAAHDLRLQDLNEKDVSLCFLPLSHIFERAWTYYVLYKGMVNNYLDDPKGIIEFIQEVKPTIMCSVPRFYEKIYATVFHRLESASPLKKRLFHWAVDTGARYHARCRDCLPIPFMLKRMYQLADALVLKKIREVVGGRIKLFPCAGAPLSPEIEAFFYAVGIFICYGYGLSETTATVTCHEPHHFKFGLVGKPLPGVQVKIGLRQEILVKGDTVMKGYFKKPEETAGVFDQDGWFRTGDAGEFDANGELRITDRIKDLMKTSGGKYIAPQMIETMIGSDHFIEQVTVVADGRRYVSALIAPAFDILEAYAQEHGIPFTSHEDLVRHPAVIELYRRRIDVRSRELANFEKIVTFTLVAHVFSIEKGEVTPTMKIKRKIVQENYQDAINGMYTDG